MSIFTQVTGAVIGVGVAFGIIIAPELGALESVHIECSGALLIPTEAGHQVQLFCRSGDAPIMLSIPEIIPQPRN